jgi:hypothetical protein
VKGRPCGILRVGTDAFLLTDDLDGLIYYVHVKSRNATFNANGGFVF